MAFEEETRKKKSGTQGLFRYMKQEKPKDVSAFDKKFYQITLLAGGGIAFVTTVLLLVFLRGLNAVYTWSAIAFWLGSLAFYALAFLRYEFPYLPLIHRFSDASVYCVLFASYTPMLLILARQDLYENGSLAGAWVSFGLMAFACALFFGLTFLNNNWAYLFGSIVFAFIAFLPLFNLAGLLNAYAFSHVLLLLLAIPMMAAFFATPIFFWCFDKFSWQLRVFYILMGAGTLLSSLITLLYVFCGR